MRREDNWFFKGFGSGHEEEEDDGFDLDELRAIADGYPEREIEKALQGDDEEQGVGPFGSIPDEDLTPLERKARNQFNEKLQAWDAVADDTTEAGHLLNVGTHLADNIQKELELDNRGRRRAVGYKYSRKRSPSPPRRKTDLSEKVDELADDVGEYVPEPVKKGFKLVGEGIEAAGLAPVLEELDIGGHMRRGSRGLGVDPAVAQDMGTIVDGAMLGVGGYGLAKGTLKGAMKAGKAAVKTAKKAPSAFKKGVKIPWGTGIMGQGMAWENFLATQLPQGARLPKNFKTFDFYDEASKLAISAKTLNTQTAARLSKPKQIYQSLKKSIDAATDFAEYGIKDFPLTSDMIKARQIEVAIPRSTTLVQLKQIERAIQYGAENGVKVVVTKVK